MADTEANVRREAQFRISKSAISGQPTITVSVPAGTELKDLVRLQETLFTDILQRLGRGGCPACLSGLERIVFEERFEDVIRQPF
jgi:hypothetical protein